MAFTQLGFRGGTAKLPTLNGTGVCGSYSKYGAYYSDESEAYCSYFISWCARKTGIAKSVINDARDVDGLFYNRQDRFVYFLNPDSRQTQGVQLHENHRQTIGSYQPQAGDLVYYRWDNAKATTTFSHIGIVFYVDATHTYTIEGCVDTRMYKRTDSRIKGYARPAY